jgi:hypothetical protein
MNARLAQHLTRLYPRTWRTRYCDEFQGFLEAHRPSLRIIFNVIGWRCTNDFFLQED